MSILRRDLVSRAWGYLAAEHRAMIGLALLAVIAAQAESAALVSVALIAEAAASGGSTIELSAGPINIDMTTNAAAIVTMSAILVAGIVGFIYSRMSALISSRLEREGRDQIVEGFAQASWEYQAAQKSSEIQGRLLRLMDARAVAFSAWVSWARALATITVFIIVAAVMSLVAALVIVLFGAFLSLAVFPIRRRIGRLAADAARREVSVAVDFAEAVDHGADVRVFGAWEAFLGRFGNRSVGLERVRASLNTTKGLMPIVYQYGALTLILGVMLIALNQSGSGEFGQFAASALLLLRSVQYGQQLQQALQNMAEAVPRIELLDQESATPPPPVTTGDQTLDGIRGIELRDISYSYPDAEVPALHSIDVTLEPGSIVGIAGPSGSGKSTLAQVILRLRWPTDGAYLVNGSPAEGFSDESWNHVISHVPQHPLLLHGSMFENVSFLDPDVTRGEATDALEQVGLSGLVHELSEGLDTEVGPTERALSGGQVQRLGIARALVRKPQLILLDEPTSALDVDSERVVADALRALRNRSDVLVLVIAHRPSTLALCDQIMVLDNGRVETFGPTDQVATTSGFLSRTWGDEDASF